jgi:Ca2+-binding EF-hand superfamily protein
MAKGRYIALTGTAFLLASALSMQLAVAGSCYKHDEDFKKQLMNKAASLFNQVDKDQDKKISREEHDHSSLSSYGVPFEKFDEDKDQYISWEEYKNQMEESHNIGGNKV